MTHEFRCNACKATWFTPTRHAHINHHACGPLPAHKKNPERERPDKRDENIAVDRAGKVLGIKLQGAGVTCLSDARLKEPPWISALMKRIADQEEKENA